MSQTQSTSRYGIAGQQAPPWKVSQWHQLPTGAVTLNVEDFRDKVIYLYFFQSWCPGCHQSGFPTLKAMTEQFADADDVAFAVIQTTFEGHEENDASKLKPTADRYGLTIPFGQSEGNTGTPDIMRQYRTGGTPWVVIIDKEGKVVFNDFHVAPAVAAAQIRRLQ